MRVLGLLILLALVPARAADFGPICQWFEDPTTTMGIQWLEKKDDEGNTKPPGGWMIDRAGFGYGDDDDQTVLDSMKGKYRSLYIRRPYTVPDKVAAEAQLVLSIRYDDGFVAYLDGVEVARAGVKRKGKKLQVKSHEAEVWEEFVLGPAVAGKTGVIAIEGHNQKIDSSDFTLRPRIDVKVGEKIENVIPEGAKWAYLAGSDPQAGWTKTVGRSEKEAPAQAVQFRVNGGTTWKSAEILSRPFGPTKMTVHQVRLRGLLPDTRYEFRLLKKGHAVGSWKFETAPQTFQPGLTFVTGGDTFKDKKMLDAMNKRAGAEDPLFALLGGDLAYANGSDSGKWEKWIDAWAKHTVAPDGRLIPMVVVIGNHEVKGAKYKPKDAPPRSDAPFFYSFFQRVEEGAAFALDFGNYLSIIGLDSGHTANVAAQTAWLDRRLAERKSIPRVFVCYHRPAYGVGVKDDAAEIQEAWCPLFEKYLVDVVFENDHHTFKRSHPLVGKKIDNVRGIPYLGDGAWGVGTRAIPKDWQKKRPWLAKARAVRHLWKVTLEEKTFLYQAMEANGNVFDETTRPVRRRP